MLESLQSRVTKIVSTLRNLTHESKCKAFKRDSIEMGGDQNQIGVGIGKREGVRGAGADTKHLNKP